ncbi:MAG: hypothetical protein ACE368_14445 [Paracoccaceae bacterium]
MKKLLTTTAVLTVAMAGAASAQSVLERVLAETAAINDVTGIFANTADNIGATATTQATFLEDGDTVQIGTDPSAGGAPVFATVAGGNLVIPAAGAAFAPLTGLTAGTTYDASALQAATLNGVLVPALATGSTGLVESVADVAGTINGSINITAGRIDEATANVGDQVTAIQSVTTNFGNFATTVLGAVNTGEIGLGTNQEVEEAIADTSQAIRSVVTQVGTTADSTVLALNSALNTMNIDGSISVDLDGVNASVAAISPDQLDILSEAGSIELAGLDQLLGNMATTVLGAVNTGTIVSGVDNQVAGTVAGIVGNSATNMFSQ